MDPAPSDQALVARLTKGDPAALDDLYSRYAPSVYALSCRILRDPASAEDVLQEVFLKLWRQPASYDPQRGPLRAWLLSVAHHRAIDVLRRAQSRGEQGLPASWEEAYRAPDGNPDPGETVGHHEAAAAVRRALAQIPLAQRQVIEMAFFEGKTHVEISAELGQPLGTAKTRIRLGMRKLRALLEAEGIGRIAL